MMNRTAPDQSFEPVEPLGVINIAKWASEPPPPREWLADPVIPRRCVSLLSGDGGLGKSTLAQMLLTACAAGKPWLGIQTAHCNTLGIFCEDDHDELWRRQAGIMQHYGLDMADLQEHDRLGLISRVGEESILARYEKWTNVQTVTPLYEQIRRLALERGAQLVVLDPVADLFAGNEIDRQQVRAFVNLLGKMAVEIDGAVLLTSHPSNEGLRSGSGISGSTAWRNTVRSHLYLTRPKASDDTEGADDNVRSLKGMKSNYSSRASEIKLRWEDGVFIATHGSTIDRIAMSAKADRVILEALGRLDVMGIRVSHSTGKNYAPAVIREHDLGEDVTARELEDAMKRALKTGKVRVERDGPPSRQRTRLVCTGA